MKQKELLLDSQMPFAFLSFLTHHLDPPTLPSVAPKIKTSRGGGGFVLALWWRLKKKSSKHYIPWKPEFNLKQI